MIKNISTIYLKRGILFRALYVVWLIHCFIYCFWFLFTREIWHHFDFVIGFSLLTFFFIWSLFLAWLLFSWLDFQIIRKFGNRCEIKLIFFTVGLICSCRFSFSFAAWEDFFSLLCSLPFAQLCHFFFCRRETRILRYFSGRLVICCNIKILNKDF